MHNDYIKVLVLIYVIVIETATGFNKTKSEKKITFDESLSSDCWTPACICKPASSSLICTNFNYFNELHFSVTNKNSNNPFKSIILKPRIRQTLAESSLNLAGLTIDYAGLIEISNIDRFYFRANPLKNLKRERFTTILKLTNSTFKFMLNENTELNSACTSDLMSATTDDDKDHSLMSSANEIKLESVDFVEPICPFIFNNVKISNLIIRNSNGEFKFQPVEINRPLKNVTYLKKPITISGLSSIIKNLNFESVQIERIDSDFLNSDVFSALQSVVFKNVSVRKIEPTVFQTFNYLKKLEMDVNWKDLVDRTELQWMYDLNRNVEVVDFKKLDKYSASKFSLFLDFGNYTFPDEDFCKFYNFPLNRYVVPYIRRNSSVECNCIIAWLLQYEKNYPFDNDFGFSSRSYTQCVNDVRLNEKCKSLKANDHCEIYSPMSLRLSDGSKKQSTVLNHFSLSRFSLSTILLTILVMTLVLISAVYLVKKKTRNNGNNDENNENNGEYGQIRLETEVRSETAEFI